MAELGEVQENVGPPSQHLEVLRGGEKVLDGPSLLIVGEKRLVVCPNHQIFEPLILGQDALDKISRRVSTVVVADGDSVALFDLANVGLDRGAKKLPNSIIKLGNGPTNQIQIDDPTVVQNHAYIQMRGEDTVLHDRSLSGTGIAAIEDLHEMPVPKNGLVAARMSKNPLVIKLGGVDYLELHSNGDTCQVTDLKTREVHQIPVDLNTATAVISVGRESDNTIVVDSSTDISRHHAKFTIIPDVASGHTTVIVKDLGSTNGTYLYEKTEETQTPDERRKINDELNFWMGRQLAPGERALDNRKELNLEDFTYINGEGLSFILPRTHADETGEFTKVAAAVRKELGIESPDGKHTTVLLVPGKKYCKRAAIAGNGKHIIMSTDSKKGTWAHEFLHAYLIRKFGRSNSIMAAEGAATYFGRKIVSSDKANDVSRHLGYSDVVKVPVLSNTQFREEAGKRDPDREEEHEYSYRIGYYFAEYMIKKFGQQAYLEFYRQTCQDKTKSDRQRDVNAKALELAGIDPAIVTREFGKFLRSQKSSRHSLLNFLKNF